MRFGMIAMAACVVLMIVASSGDRPVPAAGAGSAEGDLKARLEALEKLVPDQAHIMADVGDHFTNLWFAARAGNWPLAEFYFGETKSHLHWAVRAKPIRKDGQGNDI